jgi:hypothetical protein
MSNSSYTGDYVTRDHVRDAVECPACGVGIGRPCVGVRGRPRRSLHRERWDEYAWVEGEKVQRYLDELVLQAQSDDGASKVAG